ncbi:MAG: putative bifunctional diguanylate cyclase/phosphodiesterase [Acidimicrobiales bacterium]
MSPASVDQNPGDPEPASTPTADATVVEQRRRQTADELRLHLHQLADDPGDDFTRSLQARLILGQIGHLAVLCDAGGAMLHANDTVLAAGGLDAGDIADVPLEHAPWWRPGSSSDQTVRFLMDQARRGQPARALVDIVFADEQLGRAHELTIVPVHDSADQVAFFLAEGRDASERLAAESIIDQQRKSLEVSHDRYDKLVEQSSDLIATHDLNGRYLTVNPASHALLGVVSDELVGTSPVERVHPDDRAVLSRAFHPASPAYMGGLDAEYRSRHADGSYRSVLTRFRPVTDEAGRVLALESVTQDRTPQRTDEALVRQALADDLTGLPNRTLLLDRLQQALAASRRTNDPIAMLLVDLDDFTHVARTVGPQAADAVIQAVGQRLAGLLRPGDTVARLGGDEFALLCANTDEDTGSPVVARRLLAALDEALVVHGRPVFVGASIGIAVSRGTHDPLPLLQEAEAALVRAKDSGRGQYAVFDADEDGAFAGIDSMETALRRALERDEFVLHYQPERDLLVGSLQGFEALVRWQRDDELVPPGQFIGVAERSGLIVPLGRWVIHETCRQIRLWQNLSGQPVPPVWINLSARQFVEPDLVATITAALAEYDLSPDALCVELTESAMLGDSVGADIQLQQLSELGIRIGLDDFGTGFSSLTHLAQFPIDVLKIDRSFIAGLGHDPQSQAIVAAVIDMAHRLGITTIAEGVETRLQLDELQRLGCHQAVGFYFDRPLPATDCLPLLG